MDDEINQLIAFIVEYNVKLDDFLEDMPHDIISKRRRDNFLQLFHFTFSIKRTLSENDIIENVRLQIFR